MHKVLIVENNPVYLKLLVHFFKVEGCTIRTAKDGLTAMNVLETYVPDIIVTDIIMPKIGGDHLCRIIRNTKSTKDVFLVVLSSVFIEDQITIQDLGADLCFAKGTKTTLHECIVDILYKFENGVRRQPEIIRPEKISSQAITRELLTAKLHYETFFSNLAEAIIELNPNGQIIQANKAATMLFDTDMSGLLTRYLLEYVSGPPITEVQHWLDNIKKNAPSTFLSSYDTPLTTNGRPVLLHLMSLVEGNEIYIIGIFQDITIRKQTEQELKQAHRNLQVQNREIESINVLLSTTLSEYELIFDNTYLGIMIFREGESLSRCNQRLADILGYDSPEELKGLHMEDFHLSRKSCIAFIKENLGKIRDDTTKRVEYQLLRKNGSNVWCLLSGKALDPSSPADLSKGVVWIVDDISERKAFEQKIKHQAFYDSLTGLPNRRLLLNFLELEKSRAARHDQNGALLFIDLDNFKTINDSLGHSTGDELLKLVAGRITNNLRKEDITSRMGGDEFVIILPDLHTNPKIAAKKSQDIAKKLCSLFALPFHVAEHELHITLSIGISLIPTQGTEVEDILKQADAAMYRAKSAGRNTVRFFLPSMQKAADKRLRLNTEIKQAIKKNELCVYYQPQVNFEGGIVGAEALIRWNHPTRGFISPGDFIPIAEETGIIKDIGYWVLRDTCATIKEWEDSHLLNAHQTIAVNFSPREFSVPDFVERVVRILDETGANPAFLNIELTEGSLVSSVKDTVKKIESLRQLGIKFSIDDFGTGYSSLRYLQKLPLNTLKIDRSFVTDISDESNDSIIVETIIMMAHNLGLKVIAEGVETKEEIAYLSSKGCNVFQGYYYYKPLQSSSFHALLKTDMNT